MVPSAAGKGLTGRTIFPMAGGGEVNERSVPFAVVVGAAEGDGVISFTAEANAAAYIVALCYAVGGGENPAGADEGAGTECPTGEDFRHESEVGGGFLGGVERVCGGSGSDAQAGGYCGGKSAATTTGRKAHDETF